MKPYILPLLLFLSGCATTAAPADVRACKVFCDREGWTFWYCVETTHNPRPPVRHGAVLECTCKRTQATP